MIGRLGAQIALLAFACSIFAGVIAGNSEVTILSRALQTMVIALLLGQLVGWACKAVVREHLQKMKHQIDREHLDALETADAGDGVAGRA